MNVFITTGRMIGSPQTGRTKADKPKTMFIVEADAEPNDLPLRFSCTCFGSLAERVAEIADADRIILTGKLVGKSFNRSMSLIANSVETLGGN